MNNIRIYLQKKAKNDNFKIKIKTVAMKIFFLFLKLEINFLTVINIAFKLYFFLFPFKSYLRAKFTCKCATIL